MLKRICPTILNLIIFLIVMFILIKNFGKIEIISIGNYKSYLDENLFSLFLIIYFGYIPYKLNKTVGEIICYNVSIYPGKVTKEDKLSIFYKNIDHFAYTLLENFIFFIKDVTLINFIIYILKKLKKAGRK